MNEIKLTKMLKSYKEEGVISNLLFFIDEMKKNQINIIFDEIIKEGRGFEIFDVVYIKYFTKQQIAIAFKNAIKCGNGSLLIKNCFKFLNDKQRKIAFLQTIKELTRNFQYNSDNIIDITHILSPINSKFVEDLLKNNSGGIIFIAKKFKKEREND